MNLRQLEVFHAIMTHGSISQAARALDVAQPSISITLRHTEESLGVKLFERVRGRLIPTPEAEYLLPEVDRVHNQVGVINRMTKEMRGEGTGQLSIIGNPTITAAILPLASARFRLEFPDARIRLQTAISASQIVDRVARREFDLGFVYGPNQDVHTGVETIGTSDIACVFSRADEELRRLPQLTAVDIMRKSIVTTGVGTPIRKCAEHIFRAAGVELLPIVEVGFSAVACAFVQHGGGVAIVDPIVFHALNYPGLEIRRLIPRGTIALQVVFPKARPQSALSKRFNEILREVTSEVCGRL